MQSLGTRLRPRRRQAIGGQARVVKRALAHWVLFAIASFLTAAVLIYGLAWLIDLIQAH